MSLKNSIEAQSGCWDFVRSGLRDLNLDLTIFRGMHALIKNNDELLQLQF